MSEHKIPTSHKAVATPAVRAPLILIEAPTIRPEAGEVLIRQEWTASTPLDLHQADGGLLVTHPQILGDTIAGTVVAVGSPDSSSDLKGIRIGDKVFGFAWREAKEKAHQEYVTAPAYLVGRIPPGLSMPAAVTVPDNLVTAFNVLTADLELELPWPLPGDWRSPFADVPILVWGAASSVGTYVVQVLKHWGYRGVLAVASTKHHDYLKELGVAKSFDYRGANVVDEILAHVGVAKGPRVPLILDCIGSVSGTLEPLTRIAEAGARVAVMLPVIMRDATDQEPPEYRLDIGEVLTEKWANGVVLRGCRTHFYLRNEFFKEHLQSEIIPTLLEQGAIRPNRQRIVDGRTLLERAEKALKLLRNRDPSGERLVWKVSDSPSEIQSGS